MSHRARVMVRPLMAVALGALLCSSVRCSSSNSSREDTAPRHSVGKGVRGTDPVPTGPALQPFRIPSGAVEQIELRPGTVRQIPVPTGTVKLVPATMVWVHTGTNVFYRPGDPAFYKTQPGKMMTEVDAVAAGYRDGHVPSTQRPHDKE